MSLVTLPAVRAARRTARVHPSRARLPRARAGRSRRVRGLPDAALSRRRRQHAPDLPRRPRADGSSTSGPMPRTRASDSPRALPMVAPPRSRGDETARVGRAGRARVAGVLARRRRPAHRDRLVPARLDARRARPAVRRATAHAFSGAPFRRRRDWIVCSPRWRGSTPRSARGSSRCFTPPASTTLRRDCAPTITCPRPRFWSDRVVQPSLDALDTLTLEIRVDPSRVDGRAAGDSVRSRARSGSRIPFTVRITTTGRRSPRFGARRSSPRLPRLPRGTRARRARGAPRACSARAAPSDRCGGSSCSRRTRS